MKSPTLTEEKKLWRKGYKKVACIDEVGRGALCGPVVAAAASMVNKKLVSPSFKKLWRSDLHYIKDSKKLSSKKREEFYKILIKAPWLKWGIGRVSEKVIDRINILEATKLAMIKAVRKLKTKPNFLILDGKMRLDLPVPQKSIVKADEKVFSCAAASIIAKVWRDRIMERYHRKYPQYGFVRHKGYATKLHIKMLNKYGPCKIHRKSFKPVKTCKLK